MEMSLAYIRLRDFRSYDLFDSGELGRFNIFVGPNGIGKTNILEAVQLMTALESFRAPIWNDLVRWGQKNAEVRTTIKGKGREIELRLDIENGRRRYQSNGKGKNASALRGVLPSVMFTPDDLNLVKGSAERRRGAFDSVGVQLSATYHELKTELGKALRQKNALLQVNGRPDELLLGVWNESAARIAANLVKHRLNLFSTFAQEMRAVYKDLDDANEFEIAYVPTWNGEEKEPLESPSFLEEELRAKIFDQMSSHMEAEIAAGRCLVGPQRDDISFMFNGHDARRFASQGQQRFIALAWKIAETRTLEAIAGTRPILLLDDVLSELDRDKRDVLLDYLLGNRQTFITTTELSQIDDKILRNANVFSLADA